MENRHYLYRHIRLDKNEPFYIGIGTHAINKKSYFDRAYIKNNRSAWWKKIVDKTDYEVEILLESDNYEFIKQKEIEFIALYGRRDLGKGTLVNLTDGGDGVLNLSDESRKAKSDKMKGEKHHMFGKTHTEETRSRISKSNKGRVEPKGKDSPSFGKIHTEEARNKMSNAAKGKPKTEQHRINISIGKKGKNTGEDSYESKKVINILTGDIYVSIKEASIENKITYQNLVRYLSGKRTNITALLCLKDIETFTAFLDKQ